MEDNESILITGTERFNKYSGYADSTQFVGDQLDNCQYDDENRIMSGIVAIDAINYKKQKSEDQFYLKSIFREINKCLVGLKTFDK